MAGKRGSRRKADPARLTSVRNAEEVAGLTSRLPFDEFRRNVHAHRDSLVETISSINRSGKTVAGYGASTKGNVILQFCRFSAEDIPWIAEVNSDKFGHVTPGTMIPIVSEAEARSMNPDYFLVLPWNFRSNLVLPESSTCVQVENDIPLPRNRNSGLDISLKRSIVVGSNGQDGRILCERLRRCGSEILAITRDAAESTDAITESSFDSLDATSVTDAIGNWNPDAVFYLPAVHSSSEGRPDKDPGAILKRSIDVHVTGAINILDSLRRLSSTSAFFYAASSLVFGTPD